MGKSVCQMLAPSRRRAQRSGRVNACVQGDRKLSPLPSLHSRSFSFSVSFAGSTMSASSLSSCSVSFARTYGTVDFHATISAFRYCVAAIIGRCERKLVLLGQSFAGGAARWPRIISAESFGEKAGGYLTRCYTPPPESTILMVLCNRTFLLHSLFRGSSHNISARTSIKMIKRSLV